MPDQLSALYSEFLEGGYDCVDRVVCNAYFSMGQSGGGFRVWWRALYGGGHCRALGKSSPASTPSWRDS